MPSTNLTTEQSTVLPLLQAQEKTIKDNAPSFAPPLNIDAPSTLLSDYYKTGSTMLKNAASAAYNDLLAPVSSTVTANNNNITQPTLTVPGRGATYTPDELSTISGILYGELSNNGTPADQMNEAHKILDTAINRAKATKQTLGQVMTAPNQYQAYKSPQYWMYMIGTKQGGLDAPSQAKAALVQKVVNNLDTAAFTQSDAGNDYFYAHNSKGDIVLRNGELFKKDIPQ